MDTLPHDVLLHFFSLLSYERLLVVAKVCKFWSVAANKLKQTNFFQKEHFFLLFDENILIDGEDFEQIPEWNNIFETRRRTKRGFEVFASANYDKDVHSVIQKKVSFRSEDFVTVLLNSVVWSGKYYFEVEILNTFSPDRAVTQIGWASLALNTEFYSGAGMGDDNHSFAVDSGRGIVWSGGIADDFCEKKNEEHSIIGCGIDMNEGSIYFYRDGVFLGKPFTKIHNKTAKPFFPGISFSFIVDFRFYIHKEDLHYLPDGFKPIGSPNQKNKIYLISQPTKPITPPTNPEGATWASLVEFVESLKKDFDYIVGLGKSLTETEISLDEKLRRSKSVAIYLGLDIEKDMVKENVINFVIEEIDRTLFGNQRRALKKFLSLINEKKASLKNDKNNGLFDCIIPWSNEEINLCSTILEINLLIDPNPPPNEHPLYKWNHDRLQNENLFSYINNSWNILYMIIRKYDELPKGKVHYPSLKACYEVLSESGAFEPDDNIERVQFLWYTILSLQLLDLDFHLPIEQINAIVLEKLENVLKEIKLKQRKILEIYSSEELSEDGAEIYKNPKSNPKIFEKYSVPLREFYFNPNEKQSILELVTDELAVRFGPSLLKEIMEPQTPDESTQSGQKVKSEKDGTNENPREVVEKKNNPEDENSNLSYLPSNFLWTGLIAVVGVGIGVYYWYKK